MNKLSKIKQTIEETKFAYNDYKNGWPDLTDDLPTVDQYNYLADYGALSSFDKFVGFFSKFLVLKYKGSTLLYISCFFVNRLLCAYLGHRYEDTGYATPNSGRIGVLCTRCGEEHSEILY